MILELIGIIGGLFILIAFLYASSGRWNGKSFWYEFNNLVGSILLLYYTIQKTAYINILLNLVWGIVAIVSLKRIITRRRKRIMGQLMKYSHIQVKSKYLKNKKTK